MPSIALPVSLRGQLLSGTRTFSPASLFSANEPGVWFDPSDLTTLFQDPAGTTPVTAPGDTVGLMLDKSKGLALGAELVANGTFDSGIANWTKGAGTTDPLSWDATNKRIVVTNDVAYFASATQTISGLVVGRSYKIAGVVYNNTVTAKLTIAFGPESTVSAGGGTAGFVFSATATSHTLTLTNGQSTLGGISYWDNISVRELAGNHATQATIAARPTYSIEPVGGRRNLLTQTELFSDADWVKSSITVVSAQTVSYAGGLGTPNSRYIEQLKTIAGGTVSKTFTISALVSGTGKIRLKGTQIGIADHYSANITLSSTPTLVQYTMTNSASSGTGVQAGGFVAATDDVAFTLTATNVQFETGSTATPYQRVTTQHDVTEAGVASLGYLYFDGASDSMATSTITPGIDKAQVFAGVRKLSDATGIIAETSATVETNAGSLILYSNPNVYGAKTRGSLNISAAVSPAAYTAPTTNVLTGTGDIAGDNFTLRINGIQAAQITENQGTGDFLAYPLFIGRRDNGVTSPSYPLFGHLYSLITRFGPTLDAPTITSTETWVGDKTGIDVAKNISTTIYTRSGDTILDRANSTIERRAV